MRTPPPDLRSPYPWFGGKRSVAQIVWQRFGDVQNYIEPFFGSGAVLLNRPQPFQGVETVNDINGWLCNFWRALQAAPDSVATFADWPVSEIDLHARGDWLFYRDGATEFIERLRSDPAYFCPKSAGWWVWGLSSWIGTGWGPRISHTGMGVPRQLPHTSHTGMGVHRKRPHISRTGGGVHRKLPHIGHAGKGVHRTLPHISREGRGHEEPGGEVSELPTAHGAHLRKYLRGLARRMRGVRVCCGNWARVCGPAVLRIDRGPTAVFLDPPYGVHHRSNCYGADDNYEVSHAVRAWAIGHGDNRHMRIALCGYEGEHVMPPTWECYTWKAQGGYARSGAGRPNPNAARERIWFSPHCLGVGMPLQPDLFKNMGPG